jgi:hypothetical protein
MMKMMKTINKDQGPTRMAGLRALAASCMVTLALVASYSYIGVRPAHAMAGCTGQFLQDCQNMCNKYYPNEECFACYINQICVCNAGDCAD